MSGACSTYGGEKSWKQGLVGKLEGKNHLEDPGVDERIILNWIFSKWDMGLEQDGSGSEQRRVESSRRCDNEPSGSVKCGEFVD